MKQRSMRCVPLNRALTYAKEGFTNNSASILCRLQRIAQTGISEYFCQSCKPSGEEELASYLGLREGNPADLTIGGMAQLIDMRYHVDPSGFKTRQAMLLFAEPINEATEVLLGERPVTYRKKKQMPARSGPPIEAGPAPLDKLLCSGYLTTQVMAYGMNNALAVAPITNAFYIRVGSYVKVLDKQFSMGQQLRRGIAGYSDNSSCLLDLVHALVKACHVQDGQRSAYGADVSIASYPGAHIPADMALHDLLISPLSQLWWNSKSYRNIA